VTWSSNITLWVHLHGVKHKRLELIYCRILYVAYLTNHGAVCYMLCGFGRMFFFVFHEIILCRCRYDACPHSLRLKQESKLCVRVWLTEMSACCSYTVLAGSIVVERGGGGGCGAGTYYWGSAGRMVARGPTVLRIFLYFPVISLFVDLQIKPFRSSQKLLCNWQSFWGLVSGFFLASPILLGGPIYLPGLEPSLGGSDCLWAIGNMPRTPEVFKSE
jgi:hypothetical protein